MASAVPEFISRRVAAYTYLAPVFAGRRVLEVEAGNILGAERLLELGAAAVTVTGPVTGTVTGAVTGSDDRSGPSSADPRLRLVQGRQPRDLEAAGPFDVILLVDAAVTAPSDGQVGPAAWKRLLAPRGRLVRLVASAEGPGARGGVDFDDLHAALAPHFPRVHMFGVTPFTAFGIAEFDEAIGGLRIDTSLVNAAAEVPTHFLAIGGPDEALRLGYALVQIGSPAAVDAAAPTAPGDDLSAIRRKLAEAQGQADGALRVSRAQTEEIEELRSRLRRAAESRADLDAEVARLRRSLTDADESVVTLTRRTTEEMTSLAQRITAGLRAGIVAATEPAREPAGALSEALRQRETELAARESALADRDDRIAQLEAEKQDLLWQVQEFEARLTEARSARAQVPQAAFSGAGAASAQNDLRELQAAVLRRDQALEQYRIAALAHIEEVTRLRAALGEQSTLVSELEEALAGTETERQALALDNARLAQHVTEVEAADRGRRSRLAELEGTLIRVQRQAAMATAATAASAPLAPRNAQPDNAAALLQAERRVAELTVEVERLRARVAHADAQREITESQFADVVQRIAGLERAEEELWEAKGQLLLERERIAAIEGLLQDQVAKARLAPSQGGQSGQGGSVSEGAYRAVVEAVLRELGSLESALRAESNEVAAIERRLAT